MNQTTFALAERLVTSVRMATLTPLQALQRALEADAKAGNDHAPCARLVVHEIERAWDRAADLAIQSQAATPTRRYNQAPLAWKTANETNGPKVQMRQVRVIRKESK